MTKLTKEQIEQERVKFEEFIIKKRRTYAYFEINQHTRMYESGLIQMDFDVWLARAELTKPKARKFLPLTDKQLNVLSYIEQYINEKGYSPKFKEVQKALNFKSENSIHSIVKYLINKGYLIKNNGWRGLELAKGGE